MAEEHLILQISSALKGRISILDSADEPDKLNEFAQRFTEGQPLECRVSQVQPSGNGHTMHSTCDCHCILMRYVGLGHDALLHLQYIGTGK